MADEALNIVTQRINSDEAALKAKPDVLFGTVETVSGVMLYVILDGDEAATPCARECNASAGDRVTVIRRGVHAVAVSRLGGDGGVASNGLPAGGTAGQVLVKASDADFSAEWADDTGLETWADSPEAAGNATRANAILYGQVDSTSTATAYTATVEGLTTLYDGAAVMLKNGVVTSAAGFTINVNGLGAKPVYSNMAAATAETTIFNVNYTLLFVYDSTRIEGGCWVHFRGYDSNTNTVGYQLRTNSSTLPAADKGYRYRLWFTSADGKSLVPANVSTSTNSTTARTLNTRPIDPHGPIVYYSVNGTTNAGANLTATALWQQYTLSIGYSYVMTLTFPAPVYLRCTPNADGSAVMDAITQHLPSNEDGKIYILLGRAYSASSMELTIEHAVYEFRDGALRIWTNDYDEQITYATNAQVLAMFN